VVDGTLTEFYEFRHLTFQEYLTAKAFVEGWYADRSDADTLVSLLDPHLREGKWREIIPLTAVLAGRRAESLVIRLVERADDTNRKSDRRVFIILGNCLADEVQATPETVRVALRALLKRWGSLGALPFTRFLTLGKYGALFKEELAREFMTKHERWIALGEFLGRTVATQLLSVSGEAEEVFIEGLERLLNSTDVLTRCEGALAARYVTPDPTRVDLSERVTSALVPLLMSSEPLEQVAACIAFARISKLEGFHNSHQAIAICHRLFLLRQEGNHHRVRQAALVAFNAVPFRARKEHPSGDFTIPEELKDDPKELMKRKNTDEEKVASLVAAYYFRAPWSDEDLIELIQLHLSQPDRPWARKLRKVLAALMAPERNVDGT